MEDIALDAEEISAEIAPDIRFRDCGANLETIRCPICGMEISHEWWREQMGDEYSWDEDFVLKPIIPPCGHSLPSLNALDYHFDQGFSRFMIEAMNPTIARLTPEQVIQLEAILGCSLKVIYQHI